MSLKTRFGARVGTVGINLQGAKEQQREAQRNELIETPDVSKVIGAVGQSVINVSAASKAAEANTAKGDWLKISTSQKYLDADASSKTSMLEDAYSSARERDADYQNAFIGYSSGEYTRQYEARGKEEDNSFYNAAGASQMSWLQEPSDVEDITQDYSDPEAAIEFVSNEQAGKTPQDFVDYYTKANPRLDKVVVGRSLMAEAYTEMILSVQSADATEEALGEALSDVEDIKSPYKTPMFLSTKQKQGKEYVNQLENSLGNVIKQKQAEIKQGHYNTLAEAEKGGNRVIPSQVERSIDATASNPLAAEKQKQTYLKNYVERTQADTYNSLHPAGDRPGFLPDNKMLKEDRQKVVTNSLFNNFNTDSMNEFVRVAQNEQGMTKQAGDQFITMFNNAKTSEEITTMMKKFQLVQAQPQGASVLRQMLTDDEYTRVTEVGYAIQSRPDLTPGQARDWVDGNKAKISQMGLPPEKKRKLFEFATKLGPQYDAYLTHMNQVMIGNPAIGEKEMKEAFKHFEGMNSEDSTGKKENISMGTNPANAPEVMNTEDVDNRINNELGDNVTSKTYLSKGFIVGKDDFGGTIKIINTNSKYDTNGTTTTNGIVDTSNEDTTTRLQEEKGILDFQRKGGMGVVSGFWESAKKATSNFIRDSLDNITEIPVGVAKSGGQLVDRFGQHLHDSMSEDQQKWWDTLTEDDKSEVLIQEVDKKINTLDTSTALDGVTNNTLSEIDMEAFRNGQFQNVYDTKQLERMKEGVVGVPTAVLDHISDREGSRDSSYNDSLGKLTGGVGHLLTKEEQKKYPKGTTIPKNVRDRWLREDSRKAYKAAKEQASNFGIESEEFVNALASVNFQLGTGWTKKFPSAARALKEGNYQDAVEEITMTKKGSTTKSLWNRQTPTRVRDFVEAINNLT